MVKKLGTYFSVFLVFFTIPMCEYHNQFEMESVDLKLQVSFPKEADEVFLGIPVNTAFSEKYVFIPDQIASVILQFDYQGKYVGSIGQPGSGPGEFMVPGRAEYQKNRLFVNDIGNGRLAIIDLETNEFSAHLLENIPRSFAVSDSVIFMTHLVGGGLEDFDQLPLITAYDYELNIISTFGRLLTEQAPNMLANGSASYLKIFDERLYVLFRYYPIMHVYDFSGNLKQKIEFDEHYKKMIEQNYMESTYRDPSYINLRTLFFAFDVSDQGLYFSLFKESSIIIDHFDFNGNYKKRYINKLNNQEEYIVRDIHIDTDENNTLRFYLLNIESGLPKIDLFVADL